MNTHGLCVKCNDWLFFSPMSRLQLPGELSAVGEIQMIRFSLQRFSDCPCPCAFWMADEPLLGAPGAPSYGSLNNELCEQCEQRRPQEEEEQEARSGRRRAWVGGKNIMLLGSIALTTNNISGPAQLQLPAVFQASGWLVPLCVCVLLSVCSSLAVAFLSMAIARAPGNSYSFERRLEYHDAFAHSGGLGAGLGTWAWGAIAHAFFLACLMSQLLASMVQTASVMDAFLVAASGHTSALAFDASSSPSMVRAVTWSSAQCDRTTNPYCVPFEGGGGAELFLTAGYGLLAALIAPLSLMNLDENISVQWVSFALLLSTSAIICWHFASRPELDFARVPAVGETPFSSLGTLVFNYAFIVFIPSWLNEKHPTTCVSRVAWCSTSIATVIFVTTGVLGAASYEAVNPNMLLALMAGGSAIKAVAFVFGLGIIGLGMPCMQIMVRYSIMSRFPRHPKAVSLAACFTPWAVGWTLYRGRAASELINWSGLTVNGLTNFVAPLALAYRLFATRSTPGRGSLRGVAVAPAAAFACCGAAGHDRERRLALGLLLLLVPLSVWATVSNALVTSP